MKNKLVMRLDKHKRYTWIVCSNIQMCVLELFLSDYRVGGIPFYTEWATTQRHPMAGNISSIQMKHNTVLIGEIFSKRQDDGPHAKLRIPEFIKLLHEWEKLVKVNTETIVITLENGIVFVRDGSNDSYPIPNGQKYLFVLD